MRINYAIVFVSDMSKSVAFYRDVLGVPLHFESSHWSEFATEGATLALHSTAAEASGEGDPLDPPAGRCKPGFSVADLASFHEQMLDRGVRCIQPPKDVFGAKIAQYLDPDGLAISVGEARTPRPVAMTVHA